MKLGPRYQDNPNAEFFLRTMRYGTFPLSKVRSIYSFMPDEIFLRLIRTFAYQGVIALNKQAKTITFPRKIYLLVHFIVYTDYFNEMAKNPFATSHSSFSPKLAPYLKESGFNERATSQKDGFDPLAELNLCLKTHYGTEFLGEISALELCSFAREQKKGAEQ